jgi:hypothetical protein
MSEDQDGPRWESGRPIDPATEWSDQPTITAVEYRGRDGLIRWLAGQAWEWQDSGESHTAFATRVVDTLLAVTKGGRE